MKLYAGGLSFMALVVAAGPSMAQPTPPPQNRAVEDRLAPGGEEAQSQRRPPVDNRDNRGAPGATQQTPQQRRDLQQRDQGRDRREVSPADRAEIRAQRDQAATQNVQAFFAAKMMLCNEGIVELSQLAQEKSESDDVKQFAKKLSEDHSALNDKLQEAVPRAAQLVNIEGQAQQRTSGFRGVIDQEQNEDAPAVQPRPDQPRPGQQPDQQPDQQPGQRPQLQPGQQPGLQPGQRPGQTGRDEIRQPRPERSADRPERADRRDRDERAGDQTRRANANWSGPIGQILEIESAAAENRNEACRELLKKYEGQDFDMAFLGLQISAHTGAIAELKALDSIGNPQFQEVVAESRQKMEQHLKEAKDLAKKHEDREKQE